MCNENLNVHPAADVPNFTAVGFGVQAEEPKARYQTCSTFGIPTGVRVTFRVNGNVILTKVFGRC